MATTFRDTTGREWSIRLNVGLLGKLRREAGIDFAAAMKTESGLADVLFTDSETLVKALWVICHEQAVKCGLTPESFAYLFDGKALEEATEAVLEGTIDFFPRSKIARQLKSNLRATLEKMDTETVKELKSRSGSTLKEPASN